MRPLAFVDIDDNVALSGRKLKLSRPSRGPSVCLAKDTFMTFEQLVLLNMLSGACDLVPVTGRSFDSLATLDYNKVCERPPFAGLRICDFGGVIAYADGLRVPLWRQRMLEASQSHRSSMDEVFRGCELIVKAQSLKARLRLIEDDGIALFVRAKFDTRDDAQLMMSNLKLPTGWATAWNDRNLSLLPPFVRKAHAVAWYKQTLDQTFSMVIGSGDSLSDLDFMKACDFLLIPQHSQIVSAVGSIADAGTAASLTSGG